MEGDEIKLSALIDEHTLYPAISTHQHMTLLAVSAAALRPDPFMAVIMMSHDQCNTLVCVTSQSPPITQGSGALFRQVRDGPVGICDSQSLQERR